VLAFLLECSVETYVSQREAHRTEIYAELLVAGGHWAAPAECRLEWLQLKLTHLNGWFEPPYDVQWKAGEFKRCTISFEPSVLDAQFTFQNAAARLSTHCARAAPHKISPEGKDWTYSYELVLTPVEFQPIPWFLDLAASVRELFVFLIGSGVYTLEITGKSPGAQEGTYVHVLTAAAVPRAFRAESRYFSTRHTDYKDALPAIINEWFSRREELSVTVGAYRELLCADGVSRETVLLRTLQTLEHLQRPRLARRRPVM
jgi:hypothetical protein